MTRKYISVLGPRAERITRQGRKETGRGKAVESRRRYLQKAGRKKSADRKAPCSFRTSKTGWKKETEESGMQRVRFRVNQKLWRRVN